MFESIGACTLYMDTKGSDDFFLKKGRRKVHSRTEKKHLLLLSDTFFPSALFLQLTF